MEKFFNRMLLSGVFEKLVEGLVGDDNDNYSITYAYDERLGYCLSIISDDNMHLITARIKWLFKRSHNVYLVTKYKNLNRVESKLLNKSNKVLDYIKGEQL